MNRTLPLAWAACTLVLASGCGKNCKKAQEEVIQPTQAVATYLSTNPSGPALAAGGCTWALSQLKNVPQGAELVRKAAETQFTEHRNRCLQWMTGYRMRCGVNPRGGGCWQEPYSFCRQWDHSVIHRPGYVESMDLSRDLDLMYDRAQRTCTAASLGYHARAYLESRVLLRFILERVKSNGERVYSLACGS